MRYLNWFFLALSSVILCACATPPEANTNPQNLNDAPDLSAYRSVEFSSNSSGQRETAAASYSSSGAYLDIQLPGAGNQRLHVQPEECRNSGDAYCYRNFVLTGELNALSNQLKCYIQVRNDSNSGYLGQSLQGLCQDKYRRSYSIVLSK